MISVNQVEIPESRIHAEMQYHPAESARAAMVQAAESLIIGELLRQRAQVLGLHPGDDESFVDQLLALELDLPSAGRAECERYYQANLARFCEGLELELSHILLAAAPDDVETRMARKAQALRLLGLLSQGADFALMAAQESACPSSSAGGSLGRVGRGQTLPEFERQVFSAEPGLLPHPIETRYGYHLVLIDRRWPGRQKPFDEVEQDIADYLQNCNRHKAIHHYLQYLISEATISGYDFSLPSTPLMQ